MHERTTSSGVNFTPPAPRRRFGVRWLGTGGAALILPKCVGCLLGYAALAGGPELCGTVGGDHRWLVAGAGCAVGVGILGFTRRARSRE